MRFSAITALSVLGLALLANTSPIGLEAREASNLPSAIERDTGLSREVLDSRAGPLEDRAVLSRRKTTQADVNAAKLKLDAKAREIQDLKNERANLTPGPSQRAKKDAIDAKLKPLYNALDQLKAKYDRKVDELARGKKL